MSVRIETGQSEPKDETFHSIRLIVQDTGIGIAKSFLSTELYTPFKQENTHSSGTGLGLSIVRQICKDSMYTNGRKGNSNHVESSVN